MNCRINFLENSAAWGMRSIAEKLFELFLGDEAFANESPLGAGDIHGGGDAMIDGGRGAIEDQRDAGTERGLHFRSRGASGMAGDIRAGGDQRHAKMSE